MKRHPMIRAFGFVVLGLLGVCVLGIGGLVTKHALDTFQAQRQLEQTLNANGYTASQRTRRTKLRRQESGPFSGLVSYEMTFANAKTVKLSQQYLARQKQSTKGITATNSPIVYQATITPPTKKHPQWETTLRLTKTSSANFSIGNLPLSSYQVLD